MTFKKATKMALIGSILIIIVRIYDLFMYSEYRLFMMGSLIGWIMIMLFFYTLYKKQN